MSSYERLGCEAAYQMIIDGSANVVDIRDEESFKAGRIVESVHLDNTDVQAYIQNADATIPLIVCCYHGNMSQSAGLYLAEQGFTKVYSLDGGFAQWHAQYPDECDP